MTCFSPPTSSILREKTGQIRVDYQIGWIPTTYRTLFRQGNSCLLYVDPSTLMDRSILTNRTNQGFSGYCDDHSFTTIKRASPSLRPLHFDTLTIIMVVSSNWIAHTPLSMMSITPTLFWGTLWRQPSRRKPIVMIIVNSKTYKTLSHT